MLEDDLRVAFEAPEAIGIRGTGDLQARQQLSAANKCCDTGSTS